MTIDWFKFSPYCYVEIPEDERIKKYLTSLTVLRDTIIETLSPKDFKKVEPILELIYLQNFTRLKEIQKK